MQYQPAESNCNSTLFGMEYFAFFSSGKRNSIVRQINIVIKNARPFSR